MNHPGQSIGPTADARLVGEQPLIRRPNGTGNPGDSLQLPRNPRQLALSVRQPWAWLIVAGHKDIENRTWATEYRGPFYVHAAGKRSESRAWEEWESCLQFVARFAPDLVAHIPSPKDLQYGGVIGEAVLKTYVKAHQSPWFVGPRGFVLSDARELPFRPCRGSLGFFALPDEG